MLASLQLHTGTLCSRTRRRVSNSCPSRPSCSWQAAAHRCSSSWQAARTCSERFTSGTVAARDLRQKSQSAKAFAIEEEHRKIAKKLYGSSGTP